MSLSIYTYRVPMYFCLYPFPLIESTCVTWPVMGLKGNFMTNLPATTEVKANNFICIWVSNNCRIIYLETTITQILYIFLDHSHTIRSITCYSYILMIYRLIRCYCYVLSDSQNSHVLWDFYFTKPHKTWEFWLSNRT